VGLGSISEVPDAILDRSEELQINWNDDSEEMASTALGASSQTK
jgi:hypothetical protein